MVVDNKEHDYVKKGLWLCVGLLFYALLLLYTMIATTIGVILPPPMGVVFLLPILPLALVFVPNGPPMPRKYIRYALYCGLFLMPLWPVYLHIKLGPLPIITPTRIFFYATTAIWFYEMLCVPYRRKEFLAVMGRFKWLFWVITALFILKVVSVPLAVGKGIAFKETFRQTIIWLLPFFVVMTYIRQRRQLDFIITLIILASTLVSLIGIAEFATKTTLAEILSPIIGHAEWLNQILEAKIRDGTFRSQAVHTHPLSLGEHLAMILPFAMYKVYRHRGPDQVKARLFFVSITFIIMLAALVANSRGAYMGGSLAFVITFGLMAWQWAKSEKAFLFRPLIAFAICVGIAISPVFGAAAYKLTMGGSGSKAEQSSQARVEQMAFAMPKVAKRPIIGYGTGRSVNILGWYGAQLTIDNYYLNLILEMGIPGPVLFLAGFFIIAWMGYRFGSMIRDEYAGMYFAFTGMAISFMVTRSILSISTNIELFMVLAACFIGAGAVPKRYMQQRKRKAKPAYKAESINLDAHLHKLRQNETAWAK